MSFMKKRNIAHFPAIRGEMNGREFYNTAINLIELSNIMKSPDQPQCDDVMKGSVDKTVLRLNRNSVRRMADYIIQPDKFFPALFAVPIPICPTLLAEEDPSYCEFQPIPDNGEAGQLNIHNFSYLLAVDGGHRIAAIKKARDRYVLSDTDEDTGTVYRYYIDFETGKRIKVRDFYSDNVIVVITPYRSIKDCHNLYCDLKRGLGKKKDMDDFNYRTGKPVKRRT